MKYSGALIGVFLLFGCATAAADSKPWYLIVPPLKGTTPDMSAQKDAWLLERAYPNRDACFESLLRAREAEKSSVEMIRRQEQDNALRRRILRFARALSERPDDFLLQEKRQEIVAAAIDGKMTSLLALIRPGASSEEIELHIRGEKILEIQMEELRRQHGWFAQQTRGECLPASMVPDTVLPPGRR